MAGSEVSGTTQFEFNTAGPSVVRITPREGNRIADDQAFILVLTGTARPDTITQRAWCRVEGLGERVGVKLLQRIVICSSSASRPTTPTWWC